MSRIISFSADNSFADDLKQMVKDTGYKNRSMFLRDASIHFSDSKLRGELNQMEHDENVSGTLVIYYQHEVEHRLLDLRHSSLVSVQSYHHNCLPENHMCVDTMQVRGNAGDLRKAISVLQDNSGVDRVGFTLAPVRSSGCC